MTSGCHMTPATDRWSLSSVARFHTLHALWVKAASFSYQSHSL